MSARPTLHPCDLDAGPGLRCGRITVPAVRADPGLGDQSIFFGLRQRDDRDRPALGTIVAVEGGPGYASTGYDSAKSFQDVFAPLLRRRDLVMIDQRGTGHSGVIRCPSVQRGQVPQLIAATECARQLGPRYQGLTTAESAEDIEAVREALDLGPITLYGDSYGTLLAQAYSARYGSSLDSMVLSSAYPADDAFWRTLYPAGVGSLKLACSESESCKAYAAARCGSAFPCSWDAAARFRHALRRLQHEGGRVNGLLLYLLEAGTYAPGSYLALNRAVTDYLAGDPARLNRLADEGRPGLGDASYYSGGQSLAVSCNDYPVPWDRSAGFEERVGQLGEAIKEFPDRDLFAPLTVRQWMTSPSSDLVGCLTWPPPTEGMEPPVPEGVEQPAELPVLVLAGELDDITSVREARQVARRFPASELYIVPSRGHASDLYYPGRSPAVSAIRKFIAAN